MLIATTCGVLSQELQRGEEERLIPASLEPAAEVGRGISTGSEEVQRKFENGRSPGRFHRPTWSQERPDLQHILLPKLY